MACRGNRDVPIAGDTRIDSKHGPPRRGPRTETINQSTAALKLSTALRSYLAESRERAACRIYSFPPLFRQSSQLVVIIVGRFLDFPQRRLYSLRQMKESSKFLQLYYSYQPRRYYAVWPSCTQPYDHCNPVCRGIRVLGSNGTENSLKELSGWLIPRQKRFECPVIPPQLTDRWLLHAR